MREKKIVHKEEMIKHVQEGIGMIADIVKRTLGPGGLTIVLERTGQALDGSPLMPLQTKDGVTVAEECSDTKPETDIIIQAVKAICKGTDKTAGDGTTTAIVLGAAILKESFAAIEADSLNPQLVRESVEAASRETMEILDSYMTPIKDDLKKIEEVATISANGDLAIGKIIRQAMDEVGSEGVITVDEGSSSETEIKIVDGFQINRGAEAQDRFFNNESKDRFEAENCYVVLYNGAIRSHSDMITPLQCIADHAKAKATEEGKQPTMPPVLVIADEFSQEAIQFLLINRAQAGMTVCAVKSPHMTSVRTGMMDDMAVMLDGQRLGNGSRNLQSVTIDDIGFVERVVVSKYTTTFYDGDGSEEEVLDRIKQLKAQQENAESPYDAALLRDRVAALGQGIAKIGVGGATDMEVKERYHRIEDALNAARAAISDGVIPGGGITLCRAAYELVAGQDPTVGQRILSKALIAPFNQIIENIGGSPSEILKKLHTKSKRGFTYDARNKELVDAFEAGILDPVKVTKTALQNATSIAALLSTCGGGIVYTRDK